VAKPVMMAGPLTDLFPKGAECLTSSGYVRMPDIDHLTIPPPTPSCRPGNLQASSTAAANWRARDSMDQRTSTKSCRTNHSAPLPQVIGASSFASAWTQARGYFERALALDPGNVEAFVGTARVDSQRGAYFMADDRAARLVPTRTWRERETFLQQIARLG
jgi:hypothetical protein